LTDFSILLAPVERSCCTSRFSGSSRWVTLLKKFELALEHIEPRSV